MVEAAVHQPVFDSKGDERRGKQCIPELTIVRLSEIFSRMPEFLAALKLTVRKKSYLPQTPTKSKTDSRKKQLAPLDWLGMRSGLSLLQIHFLWKLAGYSLTAKNPESAGYRTNQQRSRWALLVYFQCRHGGGLVPKTVGLL